MRYDMSKAQTMTSDLIRCAWRSLVANRLRSALAALGIAIGVFSIIGVMTAVAVLQKTIETGVGFLGANTFQFAKYPATINTFGDERFQNRPNIDYQTYLTFSRLMGSHAEVICPKVFDKNVQAVFQNRKTNPNLEICGTNQDFVSVNGFAIGAGRNLSPDDVAFSRDFCVLGSAVVKQLFPETNAIGKTIRIDRKNYVVIGTFGQKGTIFDEDLDNQVIIPVTTFLENYGAYSRTINIAVEARDHSRYARTLSYAVGAFRQARGLQPGEPDNFEVYSNDSLLVGFRSIADKVQVGAFVVSAVALITAGVGIMNVMLVAVTERTKEIGVRKSLGAKPRDIRRQFLFEALLLSVVGAVSGILFGVIAGNFLAWFLKAEPVFPLDWSMAGVLICAGVGIGFGFYPAHKAALLDPVEALRVA
jgi:putative ABC transport system permease protein